MRHFIVELTYTVTFEQLADAIPLHRAFLQTGYDRGWVLFSGPQLPKTGGIIAIRMESLDAVKAFLEDDPFKLMGLAQYRFVEFDMVKCQPLLDSWR
jgi:uncharacterized protein YciI